jgi:pyridinium-3,5-bisthiocarboxylic acid mononucleotide nickel chelatase
VVGRRMVASAAAMADRLHLDCPSGLAGDMFLAAACDLGMPRAVLDEAVAALDLPGVTVETWADRRGGLAGTRLRVLQDGRPVEEGVHGAAHEHPHEHEHGEGHHHHHADDPDDGDHDEHHHEHGAEHHHQDHHHGRDLADIRRLIAASGLAAPVRERALQLFARLGEAEARVHGMELDRVHFHEVGAVDSIVDLVGAAAAIEHLAPERLTAGAVNIGGGTVATAHGRLPVPAPATALLVRGLPVYGSGGGELLTPTGAVLLAELVDEFVDGLPPLLIDRVGYGLGSRDLPRQPNAARLVAGRALVPGEAGARRVAVLEAEIDDLPAEGFGFLMERLLAAGALDVYFTPVQMKKGRPGTLVTALCRPPERPALAELLLVESGSLGCRWHEAERLEAEREIATVATPWGEVRVKRGRLAGRPLAAAPEFEDCRRLALEHGVPWREVWRAALLSSAGE